MPEQTSDVVVIGAGLIGLATAWRLAADGIQVTVCDPTPGTQTSAVAAGMLAPVTEVEYGEDDLLALNLASVNAWPAFAAELEELTGLSAGLHQTGTLSVAYDVDDAAALRRLADYQRRLGLEVEELSGRDARRREPLLASGRLRWRLGPRRPLRRQQASSRRTPAALSTSPASCSSASA